MVAEYGAIPYGPAQSCNLLRITMDLSKVTDTFIEELEDELVNKKLFDTYSNMMLGQNPLSYIQLKDIDNRDMSELVEGYSKAIELISLKCLNMFKGQEYQKKFFEEHGAFDVNKFRPVKFFYWGATPKVFTRKLQELSTEFTICYLEDTIEADPLKEMTYNVFFDFDQTQFPNNSVLLLHPKAESDLDKAYTSYNEVIDLDDPIKRSRVIIVIDDQANTALCDKAIDLNLRPCIELKGKKFLQNLD